MHKLILRILKYQIHFFLFVLMFNSGTKKKGEKERSFLIY